MVCSLALLALFTLDIPPGPPPKKGCAMTEGAPLAAALVLLAAPALLRTRTRKP